MSIDPIPGPCPGPAAIDPRRLPTRREFLLRAGSGFGMLALAALLAEEAGADQSDNPQIRHPLRGYLRNPQSRGPLAPKKPLRPAKARSVIFLFMSGGPSHLELFDPKPELQRLHGEKLPPSFGPVKTRRGVDKNRLLATRRTFARHGRCGMELSDWLPHLAGCVDDMALLRGCYCDSVTHPQAVYQLNTGSIMMGRPSMGAWVSYGLGTLNQNMPAFVVMPDPGGLVKGGPPAWGSGFLPADYQGTLVRSGAAPIANLQPPPGTSAAESRSTLDLVQQLNREHLRGREEDGALSARIAAYELAFRMQAAAPEVVDLRQESEATRRLYGLDRPECAGFGRQCLLARRMVERGVRFVQLYCGDTNGWDAHSDIEANHAALCARMDRPTAGLLQDLKQRGLLEETLVIWGGEFGRTPMTEGTNGRDHNPYGFSAWLAGGGVQGGRVVGATDPIGLRAAEDRTHVHDLQATLLHLLGLDHRTLTFRHNGREERLTENDGAVIEKIL
jgi:hypothetical protein